MEQTLHSTQDPCWNLCSLFHPVHLRNDLLLFKDSKIMKDHAWYAIPIVAIILLLLFIGGSYNGCVNAAERERVATQRIQQVAIRWVQENPQMALNSQTVACIPRDFGSRWPSDYNVCHATSNILNPMIGVQTIYFNCNAQGCTTSTILRRQ